jgi:hypothetical protein
VIESPQAEAKTRQAGKRSARAVISIASLLALAATLATPAFGIQHKVLHLFGRAGGPPATAIDAIQAERLLSVTDNDGGTVELWRAPNQSGGQCVYLRRSQPAAVAPPASGGGVCSVGPEAPQPVPIRTFLSWRAEAHGAALLLGGHLASDSGIAKVALISDGAAQPLPLKAGYFLAVLPDAPAVGILPSGGPYQIVGYNSNGTQVASVDLADQLARSTP